MKRIVRDRKLTPEEAAKYNMIHKQVEPELPDLIALHHQRVAAWDEFHRIQPIQVSKFTMEALREAERASE